MRIIPVLDVKEGVVVRGVAGRRSEYRPVISRLTASTEPLAVASAFRDHFGLTELYVADLDALAGAPPAFALFRQLRADGFRLMVDAGIHECRDGEPLAAAGVEGLVAGLETLAGPTALAELCVAFPRRVIFSLDLREEQPLGDAAAWETREPEAIAAGAIAAGVRRLIVLDLARVGIGAGTGTEALCSSLAQTFPDVEIIAGGGVRGPEDLERLHAQGVRAALVASALHDGRLLPRDKRTDDRRQRTDGSDR